MIENVSPANLIYCTYGSLQKDSKATLKKITEYGSAIIVTNDGLGEEQTWDQHYIISFDTKELRDNWIKEQNFQYDIRS